MKMYKDGSVEGTPQEIMEYQRLQAERAKAEQLPFKPTWWGGKVSDGTAAVKCPNEGKPCFCSGACIGKDKTGMEYLLYANER